MRVGVHVSRFVLGGLTNFQLSLNAVLAAVPVFGLRGVVLCHHFHKLARQRGMLWNRGGGEKVRDVGTLQLFWGNPGREYTRCP